MSKTMLNQIIAVANGKKTSVEKSLTALYHQIQKGELFSGLQRTYKPLADDGETQPPERKFPQVTVEGIIEQAREVLTELFDIVATQDYANTEAKADVVVDDKVVLKAVPVTHLLFLEKQLENVNAFVSKLPVLDPADKWVNDDNAGYYKTDPTVTNRNLKRYRNHVKAEATDKHPAQVETYTEEYKVGEWNTVKFSACLPAQDKTDMLARVKKLSEAVKFAREAANSMEVKKVNNGKTLLDFIFQG